MIRVITLLLTAALCTSTSAQESAETKKDVPSAFMVQVAEVKVDVDDAVFDELLTSSPNLDTLLQHEAVRLIDFIKVRATEGHPCLVQYGKQVAVTVGRSITPRGEMRNTQNMSVGTLLNVSLNAREGVVSLALEYESSRYEGEGTEDSPPDLLKTQLDTTLILKPNAWAVAGGMQDDSKRRVIVLVKPL